MNEAIFLRQEQVETLHRLALEQHGGQDGVRDPAAFESAVIHPRNVRSQALFGTPPEPPART